MSYDIWKQSNRAADAADALYEDAMEWAEDYPELAGLHDRYIITLYLDHQESLLDQEADWENDEPYMED